MKGSGTRAAAARMTLTNVNEYDVDGRCPSFDSLPLSLRATSRMKNFQQQFGAQEVCRASQSQKYDVGLTFEDKLYAVLLLTFDI